MKINVRAVHDLISRRLVFNGVKVASVELSSQASERPKSLVEILRGAVNRAKTVFNGCDLSFGIENGLVAVPHTKTSMIRLCACVIYDGQKLYFGLSSVSTCPLKLMEPVPSEEYVFQAIKMAMINLEDQNAPSP